MVPSLPSRTLIKMYAAVWVLLYWLVYFFFHDLFPEKVLTDAQLIQEIGQGIRKGEHAYGVMAALYAMLPFFITNALVGLFNGWILYRVANNVRTFRGMALLVPILIPFIMLNMQAPTKETMVLALTLFISAIAWRTRTQLKLIIMVVVTYVLYGIFLRDYYLLILVSFVGLLALLKTAPPLRWLYLLPALLVLLLVPESVFMALQGTRDQVNLWLGVGAGADVRTFFYNPFTPDSMSHFLGNYGYAFVMLNFPFLMFFTPKEILMFLNVLFYAWLIIIGLRRLQGPLRLLPLLFLAHVSVLILFEPDLGSYFRHFSSVLLYLLPAWMLLEDHHAAFLEKKRGAEQVAGVPPMAGK